MDGQPYAEAAWLYRRAGWEGVLPLAARAKWPPPRGFTGWAGATPSGADVQAWTEGAEGAGNVALRLPLGVYGLDVDAYEGKDGAAALGQLEVAHGPLPATWIVTSRSDPISGIRLYRAELPVGRRWRDEPAGHGRGVEAIHFGHRYAVVWPSVHPSGHKYSWRRPDGTLAGDGEVPALADLPELPVAWAMGLSEPGEVRTGEAAGHGEALDVVHGWREGEACPPVTRALAEGLGRLADASDGAALHPAGRDTVHELVNLGHEGHAGARAALAEHFGAFVAVRAGREGGDGRARGRAEGEWWRLVRGAVGKLSGTQLSECDCEAWSGAGLLWEPLAEPAAPPQEPAERPVEVVTPDPVAEFLGGLLSPREIAERPPPVALVRGLLYLDTLAWLIGKSGSFKSFVAWDLAAHVALGLPWGGRPVRRGRVLYVVGEGLSGLTLRQRAWYQRHAQWPDDLFIRAAPVQAGDGPGWNTMLQAAHQLDPALVVLDTQARNSVGLDENSATDMGRLVQQVDRLRRATGACVLVVHHIGRAGDDARGSSALDGAQDTEIKIVRDGGAAGAGALQAQLIVDKQKDGDDSIRMDFAMVRVDLGHGPDGEELSSLVLDHTFVAPRLRPWLDGLPEKQARVLGVLAEMFSESGATAPQVQRVLNEQGWVKGYKQSQMYTVWNELKKADRIIRVAGTERWKAVDASEAAS